MMKTWMTLVLCAAVFCGTACGAAKEPSKGAKTYKYKCPKCGLVQEYTMSKGGLKCPTDKWMMTPAN